MPINPLISNKIKNDSLPEAIKIVLNEILETEEEMETQNAQKNYKDNLEIIIKRHAENETIKNFCEKYDQ